MSKRREGSRSRAVSATEAARSFGEVLTAVLEERATYVVERHGKPVARIGPAEEGDFRLGDFLELVRSRAGRSAGPEFACAVREGIEFLNRPGVPGDDRGHRDR